MPPSERKRVYTRRVTSNGADVFPAICATICKGVQNKLDKSGCYVLDYFLTKKKDNQHPVDTQSQSVVQYQPSEKKGQ